MKKIFGLLPLLIVLLLTNYSFAQRKQSSISLDLLAAPLQANNFPKGWGLRKQGSARIEFQSGSIYLERLGESDKCLVTYNNELPNGTYLLKASFYFDGNNPSVYLDDNPLEQNNEVKAVNGKISFVITLKGDGKVWGHISRLTIQKIQKRSLSSSKKSKT